MHTKHILIVEDELMAAIYLKKILSKLGYSLVSMASNRAEALALTQKCSPDLILMDINLNEKEDGCDLALHIKNIHQTKIIFLTAHSDPDTIEKASRCKPSGYILKPYNIEQIKVVLTLETSLQTEDKNQQHIVYLIENYHFDKASCRLMHTEEGEKEKEVIVGPKALKLITLLADSANTSISNTQIMQEVYQKEVPIQTLRSLIHRIRQKTKVDLLQNINGLGYKIRTI